MAKSTRSWTGSLALARLSLTSRRTQGFHKTQCRLIGRKVAAQVAAAKANPMPVFWCVCGAGQRADSADRLSARSASLAAFGAFGVVVCSFV